MGLELRSSLRCRYDDGLLRRRWSRGRGSRHHRNPYKLQLRLQQTPADSQHRHGPPRYKPNHPPPLFRFANGCRQTLPPLTINFLPKADISQGSSSAWLDYPDPHSSVMGVAGMWTTIGGACGRRSVRIHVAIADIRKIEERIPTKWREVEGPPFTQSGSRARPNGAAV